MGDDLDLLDDDCDKDEEASSALFTIDIKAGHKQMLVIGVNNDGRAFFGYEDSEERWKVDFVDDDVNDNLPAVLRNVAEMIEAVRGQTR